MFKLDFFQFILLATFSTLSKGTTDKSLDLISTISNSDLTENKVLHTSPTCWRNGLIRLDEYRFEKYGQKQLKSYLSIPGESACATMTQEQRQILALEITKCFMHESGREMSSDFTGSEYTEEYDYVNLSEDSWDVRSSLSKLSEVEFQKYTDFYIHIHEICNRLSEEIWHAQLQETTFMVTKSYRALAKGIDQIDVEIMSVKDNLVEQQRQALENHRIQYAQHQQNFEAMNQMISQSSTELLQLNDVLKSIKDTPEQVAKNVLQLIHGTKGFTPLSSLVHFLVILNCLWLLTAIQTSHRARPLVFVIATCEFISEIFIHWLMKNGLAKDLFEYMFVPSMRIVSISLELLVLIAIVCRNFTSNDEPPSNFLRIDDVQDWVQNEIDHKISPILERSETDEYLAQMILKAHDIIEKKELRPSLQYTPSCVSLYEHDLSNEKECDGMVELPSLDGTEISPVGVIKLDSDMDKMSTNDVERRRERAHLEELKSVKLNLIHLLESVSKNDQTRDIAKRMKRRLGNVSEGSRDPKRRRWTLM